MEILSAYVREKAKKKEVVVKNTDSNSNKIVNNEVAETKENTKNCDRYSSGFDHYWTKKK